MPTFGPYELMRRLGIGGMGEVFLARLRRQDDFEKLLVIKRILPQFSSEAGFRAMFCREARLAAQLSHQNIVQIFDYGEAEGQSFIAMEFVDGLDTGTLLERAGRLPAEVVLSILEQAVRGLDYAHRKADAGGRLLGLVHRDVTPRNLLVSCEGEVKWIDFGLANALRQERDARVAGTLPYMAPEQAEGAAVDARADLFGLGVTAYELLTGTLPFTSPSCDSDDDVECAMQARVDAVRDGELVPVSDRVDDTAPVIDLLIARALAADPRERFQSAREMLAAIEAAVDEVGSASPRELAAVVRDHRSDAEAAPPIVAPERTLVGDDPVATPEATTEPGEQWGGPDTGSNDDDETDGVGDPHDTPRVAPVSGTLRTWHLASIGAVLVAILGVWAALASGSTRNEAAAVDDTPAAAPSWTVTIRSRPSGATVYLDDASVGQTPLELTGVAPRVEPVAVRLEAPRHAPARAQLELGEGGGRLVRDFELEALNASLVVRVTPATARVKVNGVPTDPSAAIELPPGPVVIVADADGYRPATASIELAPGAEQDVALALEPQPGNLRVDVSPSTARVEVRRLGEPGGQVLVSCQGPCIAPDLTPGNYLVTATVDDHEPATADVQLGPGRQLDVELVCQRLQAAGVASGPTARLNARNGRFGSGRQGRRSVSLRPGKGFEFRGGDVRIRGLLARGQQGWLLTLRPSPWTALSVDGKTVHKAAELFELPLARGRHRVRLPDDTIGFDVLVP